MKALQTALAIAIIAGTTSAMAAKTVEANEVMALANAAMPETASVVAETVATAQADTFAVKDAVVAQVVAVENDAAAKVEAAQVKTQARLEAARKIIAEKALMVNDIPAIKISETQNGVAKKVADISADVAEKTAQAKDAAAVVTTDVTDKTAQVKDAVAEVKADAVATTEQAKGAVTGAENIASEQVKAVTEMKKACPKKSECLKKKAQLDAAEAVEKKGWFSWFKKSAA